MEAHFRVEAVVDFSNFYIKIQTFLYSYYILADLEPVTTQQF